MSATLQSNYREPRLADSKDSIASVPNEFKPTKTNQMLDSQVRHNVITPTNAQSAVAGGQLTFQINGGQNNEWLKPKTVLLSCTLTPTVGAGYMYFKGMCSSASAIINRLSVYVNNVLVEQIDNYNTYKAILYTHCTSPSYVNRDLNIMELSTTGLVDDTIIDADSAILTANSYSVGILLNCGLFDSNKSLPLWLVNNIQVVIDFNSLVSSVVSVTGGQTVTALSITNPKLIYTTTVFDKLYNDSLRALLDTGMAFSLNMNMIKNYSVTRTADFTETHSFKMKSLNGIFMSSQLSSAIATTDGASGRAMSSINGMTQYSFLVDSTPIPSSPVLVSVTNQAQAYYHLNAAIGNLSDATITSNCDRVGYTTAGFVIGNDLRKSKSTDFALNCGTAVDTVYPSIVGVTASALYHFFYSYSAELLLTSNGDVRVVK